MSPELAQVAHQIGDSGGTPLAVSDGDRILGVIHQGRGQGRHRRALRPLPRDGHPHVIFNAIIIVLLIPLALRGVKYRPIGAAALLRRSMLIYGVGGVIAPFAASAG